VRPAVVALPVFLCVGALPALAEPETVVSGRVIGTHSEWNVDGTAIVTETRIDTGDGRIVTLSQLGGATDDLVMWSSHSPTLLAPGDEITAIARPDAPFKPMPLVQVLAVNDTIASDGLDSINRFVQAPATNGNNVFWKNHQFTLVYDAEGTSHLAGDREFDVLDNAFRTWQEAAAQCGSTASPLPALQFVRGDARSMEVAARDRVNLVKFRELDWSRPDPNAPNGLKRHSSDATGMTTLTWKRNTGELIDADIELNAVNYVISQDGQTEAQRVGCLADLQNTVTHEVGHFLGLEHPCWDPSNPQKPRLTDHLGNLVPICEPADTLPPGVRAATMYNFQTCGEMSKRDLEPIDVAGLCAVLAEEPETGCGCRSGSLDGSWILGLLALLLNFKLRNWKTENRKQKMGSSPIS
jgi:hypothetical protein